MMVKIVDSIGLRVTPMSHMDGEVVWFCNFLKEHSIDLANESKLAIGLSRMTRWAQHTRNEIDLPVEFDALDWSQSMFETSLLIKAVYLVVRKSIPSWLTLRVQECSGKDLLLSQPVRQSKARDLQWELLTACCLSQYCEDIVLEEPDVLATYKDIRWGIACKVLYSPNRSQNIKQIIEGAKQIEKSSANYGIVFINAGSAIDHSHFFRRSETEEGTFLSFKDRDAPLRDLVAQLSPMTTEIMKPTTEQRIIWDKKNNKPREKTRAVSLIAQTVTSVRAVPTLMTQPWSWAFRGVIGPEIEFVTQLLRYLKTLVEVQVS